ILFYTPEPTDIYTLSLHDALPIYEQNSIENLSLYPNPTKGEITLEWNSADAGKTINIELYDLLGRSLYSTTAETTGGNQKVELRSEEHTSELQSRENLVCRLLLEK